MPRNELMSEPVLGVGEPSLLAVAKAGPRARDLAESFHEPHHERAGALALCVGLGGGGHRQARLG